MGDTDIIFTVHPHLKQENWEVYGFVPPAASGPGYIRTGM